MAATDLIDPIAIREFLTAFHTRAAAAFNGVSRPGVVQLCSKFPDESRMYTSAFNIGGDSIEHMAEACVIDAQCGKNTYCEVRSVRNGHARERQKAHASLGVFAIAVDNDVDRNRAGPSIDNASITVETSANTGNSHQWFFLKHALTVDAAKAVGDQVRKLSKADTCSGVVTGCYRIAGTPCFVDQTKKDRGRVTTPTRLINVTEKLWDADELIAAFSKRTPRRNSLLELKVSRLATPAMDRSAVFMGCVHAAFACGMSAGDLEALMRQHPDGCAQKYLENGDRLKAEIQRSWAKAAITGSNHG
jgi:hypothetical protein